MEKEGERGEGGKKKAGLNLTQSTQTTEKLDKAACSYDYGSHTSTNWQTCINKMSEAGLFSQVPK